MAQKSLNKCQFIGNVGKDPEMRYTPNGKAVTTLSLAVNRSYKNSQGQQVEEAEWLKVEFWDKAAELVNQYVTKGRRLYVEGRLKTDKWDDPNTGVTKYFTKIVANDFILLDGKNGASQVEEAPVEEEGERISFS